MIYELKHFDKTVLKFSAVDNSNEPDVQITWVDDDSTDFILTYVSEPDKGFENVDWKRYI